MARIKSTFGSIESADILDFENRHQIRLPSSYRKFIRSCNGGSPVPSFFEDNQKDVRVFLQVILPMTGRLIEEYLDHFVDALEAGYLPVGLDGGGNIFLLGLEAGAIYFWDHERDPSRLRECSPLKIAESLPALVARLEFADWQVVKPAPVNEMREFAKRGLPGDLPQFLASHGIDQKGSADLTLAEEATRSGNLDLLMACIDAGAGRKGLLHIAASGKYLAIVEYLLKVGMSINELDEFGDTPLDCALAFDEVRNFLKVKGAVSSKRLRPRKID